MGREDAPQLVFLLGQDQLGLDRTVAVVEYAPSIGSLYQVEGGKWGGACYLCDDP